MLGGAAALAAALLALASARSDASEPAAKPKPPKGGTFRVVFAPPEQLDTMDPAIANTQASWSLRRASTPTSAR